MAQLAAQDYFTRLQASGLSPFPHPDLAAAFPGMVGMGGVNASGSSSSGNGGGGGGGSGGGGGGGRHGGENKNTNKGRKEKKSNNNSGSGGGNSNSGNAMASPAAGSYKVRKYIGSAHLYNKIHTLYRICTYRYIYIYNKFGKRDLSNDICVNFSCSNN